MLLLLALPALAGDELPQVYGMRGVDLACAACLDARELGLTASASSTLSPESRYGAALAVDGELATAWCEGAEGAGSGTTLHLHLARPAQVYAVAVFGGYFKSAATLRNNHRLRTATWTIGERTWAVDLADPAQPLAVDPSTNLAIDPAGWFDQARAGEPPWVIVDSAPVQDLVLTLDQVWPGQKAEDTCLSEIAVQLVDPDTE